MIFGSVCSGIEAASAAWYPLGWRCAFMSEIEPFPRAVLRHHYPDVPLHGDFTTIKDTDYGTIDLLVGGTPCQAFSVAGLRKGFSDDRGNLTLEFLRLVKRKKPRIVVWENVPGVLSIDGGRAFGTFLAGLAECGYGFAYRILDARYFGVPQRRRRVFVIGYFGDWRIAAAILFERESLLGDITPRRQARESIAATIRSGTPNGGAGHGSRAGDKDELIIPIADTAPTIPSRATAGGGMGTDFDLDGGLIPEFAPTLDGRSGRSGESSFATSGGLIPEIAHTLRGEGFDASEDGCGRGIPLIPETACALVARDSKGADSDTKSGHLIPCVIPINTQIATRHEALGEGTGMGIGNEGDPAFTLQASHSHAVAIPIQDKATRYKGGGATRADDGGANGLGIGQDGDPFPTLGAHDIHAVGCFKGGNGAKAWGIGYEENIAPTIASHENGNRAPMLQERMQVRRLIPLECERLQGFKDNYTLIPYPHPLRVKLAADGPRYKALGNSMAVPVMAWIGERIDKVETLLKELGHV